MPRHEGIRQHKSGLWEVRIRMDDKRRSFYAQTFEEADALKAEKLNDKRQGLPVAAKGTVADFLADWLEGMRHSIDPATDDQYSQHVRLYLAPRVYRLWPRFLDVLVLVRATTVIQWHRQGFRRYWRWRSRSERPSVDCEIRVLIRQMSGANPL
jgi:hypothetical protein